MGHTWLPRMMRWWHLRPRANWRRTRFLRKQLRGESDRTWDEEALIVTWVIWPADSSHPQDHSSPVRRAREQRVGVVTHTHCCPRCKVLGGCGVWYQDFKMKQCGTTVWGKMGVSHSPSYFRDLEGQCVVGNHRAYGVEGRPGGSYVVGRNPGSQSSSHPRGESKVNRRAWIWVTAPMKGNYKHTKHRS